MPDDDLLTLLLGCGCRKRCCCGADPDPLPGPPATPLFGQAPRTILPPRLPDETPFIPTPASYDSPQLPDRWGSSHWPEVLAGGVYAGTGGGTVENTMIRDDGTLQLLASTRVDHRTREVLSVNLSTYSTDTSDLPDPADHGVPSSYAVLTTDQDPRVQPYAQYAIDAGYIRRTWTALTIPFGPGAPASQEVTGSAPGSIRVGQVSRMGPGRLEIGTAYWRRVYWFIESGDGASNDSVWTRTAQILTNLVEPDGNYLVLQSSSLTATRAGHTLVGEPPRNNPVDAEGFQIPNETHRSGRLAWTGVNGTPQYPDDLVGADRWVSPDGQVRVTGRLTNDHALLEPGAELHAYGHTLTLGTWAALCGPALEDGSAPAWVVHEHEGTVSLITPDGTRTTLPRGTFAQEVLRAGAAGLARWACVGHLSHSWPPHWAVADLGAAGYRAVILHDPWRDSRAASPPPASTDPPEWSWPARPRRRPTTLPLTAPGALLGLTLADVFRDPATGGPVDS